MQPGVACTREGGGGGGQLYEGLLGEINKILPQNLKVLLVIGKLKKFSGRHEEIL